MTPCLSPDEFVDLVDGTLAPARRAHVTACAACHATAEAVRDTWQAAAAADVPEPPASFWPSLNVRVRAALADDAAPVRWRTWWPWQLVVPVTGLALVIVALASAIDRAVPQGTGRAASETAATIVAARAGEAAPDDDALSMMVDLAESLPGGGWDALDVTRLPDLDVAASALSADEQRALADLLQAAVERPKS